MKGEVRNPTTVWLLSICTCHLYGLYWFYTMENELKNYLGKDDLNPTMDAILGFVCGLWVYYLAFKQGKLIQEAQMRAGIPNPEDNGVTYALFMLLCGYGYAKMQEELNKVWEAGGGAPAAF